MADILVFGDSIAWGAYDSGEGGWVSRLKTFLEKERNFNFSVYNLAVSGEETSSLLKKFVSETSSRTQEKTETIIIFAIGINDSYFIHSQKSIMTQTQKFRENIKKLIDLARKFSSEIIFVGLTPVDESITMPMPWDTDKSYFIENIKRYDKILKETCRDENIHFIEIFDNWTKFDYKKLLEDGAHPNSEGHKRLFETVKDYLISKNII